MIAPFGAVIASGTAAAAGSTCTWTGSGDGTSWSDSSNWSGCGGAPQDGDSLSFDTNVLTGYNVITNDITNLQVGSIAFSGPGPYGFGVNGNGFSLSGGITDNSTVGNTINTSPIILTADQTFSTTTGGLLAMASALTAGTHTLTLSGGGWTHVYAPITGSGTLIASTSITSIDNDNPNFSGRIQITSGTLIINAVHPMALGTGSVTIADGSTLQESINANGTYSITNPITVAGDGANNPSYGAGALIVHGYSATGTVNFTGPITLTGNATVGLVGANASIAGSVSGCGYNLSTASGASGTLSGTLAGSCGSNTPSTSGSNSGITDPGSAPAAPNTGYGRPLGFDPITAVLVVGSAIVVSAGLALIYYHPRNHKHL